MTSSIKLISSPELRRLRTGSYELRIEEATQVARGCMGEKPFEVISTREKDVVVYSEGFFYRIPLGGETLPKAEMVDVEIFEGTHSRSFSEREAQTIVGHFLKGALKTAVLRLEDFVLTVPSSQGVHRQVLRVEALAEFPCVWRRIFKARLPMIESFVAEKRDLMLESRIPEDAGLDIVLERWRRIEHEVTVAHKVIAERQEKDGDAVLRLCLVFAEDLLRYLCSISEASLKAQELTTDRSSCDKLLEVLVEALGDCEVASCFVSMVADKLGEAS